MDEASRVLDATRFVLPIFLQSEVARACQLEVESGSTHPYGSNETAAAQYKLYRGPMLPVHKTYSILCEQRTLARMLAKGTKRIRQNPEAPSPLGKDAVLTEADLRRDPLTGCGVQCVRRVRENLL